MTPRHDDRAAFERAKSDGAHHVRVSGEWFADEPPLARIP